ncbi:MAG: TlpA disulfide reductase family protein [Bryobacterales bacterium]
MVRQSLIRIVLLLLAVSTLLSGAVVPRPAPPLRMKTLSGDVTSLWALRGKVVVVMFFSTDCGHCHEAAKVLVPLHKELRSRGFEILGVATNSKAAENLDRFADVFDVEFPLAVGSRVDWARFGRFPVRSRPPYVPHLLFVDRSGTIRGEFRGEDRAFYDNLEERFRAVVEPLLEEPHAGNPSSD